MSLTRNELSTFLEQYLNIAEYDDYGPNGLQVEGIKNIKHIAYAVSATVDSIQKAIDLKADALIVHHGLFWKFHGPKTITGAFAKRILPIIKNDLNLFAYHLPLDGHIEIGNAAQIAHKLKMKQLMPFGSHKGMPTGVMGTLENDLTGPELSVLISSVLKRDCLIACDDPKRKLKSLGIITGGANSDWKLAKKQNLDAYLTGEISEHDWHDAIENEIVFIAGGHNATEQYGVQGLQSVIEKKYADKKLTHTFIPSDNPV